MGDGDDFLTFNTCSCRCYCCCSAAVAAAAAALLLLLLLLLRLLWLLLYLSPLLLHLMMQRCQVAFTERRRSHFLTSAVVNHDAHDDEPDVSRCPCQISVPMSKLSKAMSDSGPNLLPLHPSSLEGAEHHNPNSRVPASPEAFLHASAPVPRRQHPPGFVFGQAGFAKRHALPFEGLRQGARPDL